LGVASHHVCDCACYRETRRGKKRRRSSVASALSLDTTALVKLATLRMRQKKKSNREFSSRHLPAFDPTLYDSFSEGGDTPKHPDLVGASPANSESKSVPAASVLPAGRGAAKVAPMPPAEATTPGDASPARRLSSGAVSDGDLKSEPQPQQHHDTSSHNVRIPSPGTTFQVPAQTPPPAVATVMSSQPHLRSSDANAEYGSGFVAIESPSNSVVSSDTSGSAAGAKPAAGDDPTLCDQVQHTDAVFEVRQAPPSAQALPSFVRHALGPMVTQNQRSLPASLTRSGTTGSDASRRQLLATPGGSIPVGLPAAAYAAHPGTSHLSGYSSLPSHPGTSMGMSFASREELVPLASNEYHWSVIDPASSAKLAWDVFVGVFILVSVLSVPYFIGFDQDPTGFWFGLNVLIDTLFIVDMIASFRTGYYNDATAVLVSDTWKIARRYLLTWFLVDLISAVPWDAIISAFTAGSSTTLRSLKLVRVLRLARLAKLFRLFRLTKTVELIELSLNLPPALMRLLKLFFQVWA